MSLNLELNVYDKKGKITKTCTAQMVDLEFGTIRGIMEVLNVEDIEDTAQLLKTVYGAWDKVTEVLSQCFPDMKHDDWEHVKIRELLPMVVNIMRYSFAEIMTIPKEKN